MSTSYEVTAGRGSTVDSLTSKEAIANFNDSVISDIYQKDGGNLLLFNDHNIQYIDASSSDNETHHQLVSKKDNIASGVIANVASTTTSSSNKSNHQNGIQITEESQFQLSTTITDDEVDSNVECTSVDKGQSFVFLSGGAAAAPAGDGDDDVITTHNKSYTDDVIINNKTGTDCKSSTVTSNSRASSDCHYGKFNTFIIRNLYS